MATSLFWVIRGMIGCLPGQACTFWSPHPWRDSSPSSSDASGRKLPIGTNLNNAGFFGMDRSVFTLLLVLCALPLLSTPMGAALRPHDLPPSLEAFIEYQPGSTREALQQPASLSGIPLFAAWREHIAELFSWQMVEKSCLATAIYFEFRSEPTLGQLAVANVVINRTKSQAYPSTICGVVFQGSNRLNSCQFSFACDGKSDTPEAGQAWKKATALAYLLLPVHKKRKYDEFLFVSNATHYHTIDVQPRWSKSLGRLNQIGRHMFYS